MKWFKKWKDYMGMVGDNATPNSKQIVAAIKESNSEQENSYPGPIYNEDIIIFEENLVDPEDIKGITRFQLKPGLKENSDYILVPEILWELWAKIYGGLDLPRLTYSPPDSMRPIVEVYFQRLPIAFKPAYKWLPAGLQCIYISRRETASRVREKAQNICAKILKEKLISATIEEIKFRLWKIPVQEIDELDEIIRKADYSNRRKPVGIEADLVDESKSIEDLGIGESFAILVEMWLAKNNPIFVKKVVVRPRMDSELSMADENDWKKYATLEGMMFTKIPLKILANPSTTRCGRTGLENLGNTCYMNSGLQCLSNCQELTKYFLTGLYRDDINKVNPLGQKGYLAEAYATLNNDMWRGNYRAVSAYDLKKRITLTAGQFRGYDQQDSQELIIYMLDGLHEDLNRIKKKPYIENKDYDDLLDETISDIRWKEHKERNNSIIMDLFSGQLKSRLVCPECKRESTVFDPFIVLSVPIPQVSPLEIIFVPENMTKGAQQIRISATDGTSIAEIHRRLLDLLNLSKSTHIFYASLNENGNLQELKLTSNCSHVLRNGCLYAYEYQAATEDNYFLEINCQYIVSGMWSSKVVQLKHPLVLSIPLSCSLYELRLRIFERLQPFIKDSVSIPDADNLKTIYESYFGEDGKSKTAPYNLEIVNNREKVKRFLIGSKYEDCEFCINDNHSENCLFSFRDEDKLILKNIVDKLAGKRRLILALVLNQKLSTIIVDKLKGFFDTAKIIKGQESHKEKISLYDCLEYFSTEEQLDEQNKWYCSKCKNHVQARKKMDLYKVPTILIVHLKRFKNKGSLRWGFNNNQKIDDFIDYPITGLDLRRYVRVPPAISGAGVYDLFAVSNHFGGLSGGHYTATCYNSAVDKWLYFNDSSVCNASDEDAVSSAGYVLFYRKVDDA